MFKFRTWIYLITNKCYYYYLTTGHPKYFNTSKSLFGWQAYWDKKDKRFVTNGFWAADMMMKDNYIEKNPPNLRAINKLIFKDIFEDILLGDERDKNWRNELDK